MKCRTISPKFCLFEIGSIRVLFFNGTPVAATNGNESVKVTTDWHLPVIHRFTKNLFPDCDFRPAETEEVVQKAREYIKEAFQL